MPLRVVPSLTGLPSKRCPGIGFLSRAPENRGRLARGTSHMASLEFPPETGLILRCTRKPGTPSRESRGIDSPVAISRGEGAQMKWCREPRCSPRVIFPCYSLLSSHLLLPTYPMSISLLSMSMNPLLPCK